MAATYHQRIAELRERGDVTGAFSFLERLFKDEANQKIRGRATDYLYEDDDDRDELSPAQGFDTIVAAFSPEQPIAERVDEMLSVLEREPGDEADERGEREQLLELFRPLNAIAFTIQDYEVCDARAESGWHEPATGRFEPLYRLNYEIIAESDSDEDYRFVYELGKDDQYAIRLGDERVPGKALYFDLKVTLFSRYLLEVVEALARSPRFARLSKALPFHFLIRSGSLCRERWLYPLAIIDEASLAANPLADEFLASRPPRKTPSLEQRYRFLRGYLSQPDTEEHRQLAALVREHRNYFDDVVAQMDQALAAGRGAVVAEHIRFLWSVVDAYESDVPELHERVLAAPAPALSADVEYAGSAPVWMPRPGPKSTVLERVTARIPDHIAMLRACHEAVPDGYRGAMEPAFRAALARLRQHENAAVRVLAAEAEAGANGVPDAPSGDYVAAVIDSIELLGDVPEDLRDASQFVTTRLAGLGERAAAAIPALVRKLEDRHESALFPRDVERFAPALQALGCEQVPDAVHRAHEREPLHFPTYKAWCELGPTRAWQRLAAAYADDPDRLSGTAAWEQHLYASDAGYRLFAKKLADSGLDEAAIGAAAAAPAGPKLSRQLLELARYVQNPRSRDDEDHARMLRYLERIPAPDAEAADLLEWTRAAVALRAVERGDDDAGARIAKTRARYPENATLLFIDVDRQVRLGDPAAAMDTLIAAIPRIIGTDRLYQTAFCELAGGEAPSRNQRRLSLTPRGVYPLYRVARDRFREECFSGPRFRGIDGFFRLDPFYYGIHKHLRGPRKQVAAALDRFREEWDFVVGIDAMSDAVLRGALNPARWNIAMTIARRFAAEPNAERTAALIALLSNVEDMDHKMELCSLLWPVAPDGLLGDDAFQAFLPTFILHYPEPSIPLTRRIAAGMADLGMPGEVLALCRNLPGELVIAVSKTLRGIFTAARLVAEGAALYEHIADELGELAPNWTLAMNNAAVLHAHAGDLDSAEAALELVFEQDTARFEAGDDDIGRALFGDGDVETRMVRAFWDNWGMARFNQACLFARTGRPDAAMESLREAVARRDYGAAQLLAEEDLAPLRERSDFVALVQELRSEEMA